MNDVLKRFWNQNLEQRPTECVAECFADICANLLNQPFDAGFTYAATLKVENAKPNAGGSDPLSAIQSAIIYGCLPTDKEPFDATTTSESYEADFSHYAPEIKHIASLFPQNGWAPLNSYQDVVNWLNSGRGGVLLPITFSSSFYNKNSDGTLPEPSGVVSNHCTVLYDMYPQGISQKMGLGPDYGYCYLTEERFNQIWFGVAYGIDTTKSRWFSLVKILLGHRNLFSDIYPLLSVTKG